MRDVIVFTKVPEKGQVKTRLQKRLPSHVVEELYTAFLLDTLDQLKPFYPYVAYWPPNKLQILWNILGECKYLQQNGKDLGEKLVNLFGDFYKMGVQDIVAVGCDVPLLRTKHVEEAFKLMGDNDVVLGPSHDGGFYLIGGKCVNSGLLSGVNWDGADVFAGVKANAEKLGLKCAVLPELLDVDTPEDIDAVWKSGKLDEDSRTYRILKRNR
jgi:uncharacterized protein